MSFSNIYFNTCVQLHNLHLRNLVITTNKLHNSTLPAFNISIFTEEDGATITNEDEKEIEIRKNIKIY